MSIVYPVTPEWATPIVRALEFGTQVVRGRNGTEQRWMTHPGRASWTLPYTELLVSERDTLLATFDAAKGSADQTVQLVFEGTTYDGLYFEEDRLEFTETEPGQWSGSVKLCQVTRVADSGVLPSDFPALDTGAALQLPARYGHEWETEAVRTEGGRTAYANRTAKVRGWSVGGPVLTDAEAAAIWEIFGLAQGMYRTFGFTDPDSEVTYSSRFGADRLEWRILGAGVNAVQTSVVTVL